MSLDVSRKLDQARALTLCTLHIASLSLVDLKMVRPQLGAILFSAIEQGSAAVRAA